MDSRSPVVQDNHSFAAESEVVGGRKHLTVEQGGIPHSQGCILAEVERLDRVEGTELADCRTFFRAQVFATR